MIRYCGSDDTDDSVCRTALGLIKQVWLQLSFVHVQNSDGIRTASAPTTLTLPLILPSSARPDAVIPSTNTALSPFLKTPVYCTTQLIYKVVQI